ncbi:MAG: NADPH-dependent FMN reductase [Niabella sp.]
MKIEVISGSSRAESITLRAALAVQAELQKTIAYEVGLIDCRTFRLPTLEKVFSSVKNTPDEFKPLAEKMFAADGFILVTPEYNGSFAPALKNLLDHFPKQLHKPIGIVTASNGNLGGMRAAQQMVLLAVALFGIPSPQLLVIPQVDKKFAEDGTLLDELFYKNIHNFISEYLWLTERLVK